MNKLLNEINTSQDLLSAWRDSCRRQIQKKKILNLTCGLEVEFFLLGKEGNPANLSESQQFLSLLFDELSHFDSAIKSENEMISGKSCLSTIKYQRSLDSWIAISYEYSPHLLEVSFNFHSDLNTLEKEINFIFKKIDMISLKCNFSLSFTGKLEDSKIKKISNEINESQRNLRGSRVELLSKSSYPDDQELINFPSFIAATHVHISGYPWWENSSFINRLYRIEPFIMLETGGGALSERWSFYQRLFSSFPLLAFPDYEEWTFEKWIEDLYQYSFIPKKAELKSYEAMNKLRDLQLIRPRAIGTVEFRADCTQPSTKSIMRLLALRLGQYILAENNKMPHFVSNYRDSRERWYNQLEKNEYIIKKETGAMINIIYEILKERGYGEESFLNLSEDLIGKTN